MAQIHIIGDWSGGLNNSKTSWGIAQNESPDVSGFIGEDGPLVSISGPLALNTAEIVSGQPIQGMTRFYKTGHYVNNGITTTKGWTVAKCGTAVWLDVSGSGDFRPILGGRTQGDEYFAPMAGRLYISNGTDYNIRWDGNFYCTGTVTIAAGTPTTVTGSGTSWQTYSTSPKNSLLKGDLIFFKVAGVWDTIGHRIVAIGSNTSLTLADNGPTVSGVQYIICRTHLMGLTAQTSAVTDGSDSASSGNMEPGTYYYKWTVYNSQTGFESDPAPVSQQMRVNAAGGVQHGGVLFAGTGYTADTTYATTGGTGTGCLLRALTVSGGGGILTYSIPDGGEGYTAPTDVITVVGGDGNATKTVPTVDVAHNTQRISGIPSAPYYYGALATPTDYQVDQIRLYRTKKNTAVGSTYYRVDYGDPIDRDQSGYTFLSYYDDKVADSALGSELVASGLHRQPPVMRFMYQHTARMYGFGNSDYPNRMYFSTVNAAEYWPTYLFGSDTPTANSAGGYVSIGDGISEEVTALVPEGGAYIQSGETGGDLLVFTGSKANRWYGSDWSDFSRTDAYGIGCSATRTCLNCNGTIVWLSADGIKACASGGNQPITISKKVKADIPDDVSTGYVELSAAVYWRDWYVISVPLGSSTVNSKTYLLHLPTGTVYQANFNAASFCVWNGPGDGGQLYYGSTTQGKLYQYKPTAYLSGAASWTSRLFDFAGSPNEVYPPFHVRKIIFCWIAPATTQTFTLDLYANGDTGTALKQYVGQSVGAVGTTGTVRRYVLVEPSVDARSIQLKVSGTFTAEMVLEWIRIEYQRHAVQAGTTVGR